MLGAEAWAIKKNVWKNGFSTVAEMDGWQYAKKWIRNEPAQEVRGVIS